MAELVLLVMLIAATCYAVLAGADFGGWHHRDFREP